MLVAFIAQYRREFGVESICRQLPFAPSAYYEHKAGEAGPSGLPERHKRGAKLREDVRRVCEGSGRRCGARKVYRDLTREGVLVARCTVERLMREQEVKGVSCGGFKRTHHLGKGVMGSADLVNRSFTADGPNQLWVTDLT